MREKRPKASALGYAEAHDFLRGLVLCEARPGVTLAWWESASRERRDAAWAAAELLTEQAEARRNTRRR